MIKNQFFIYGNPRSGSSLLRLLLNSHSQICVPPECGFYHWLASKYGSWNPSNLNAKDIDAYIEDLQNCKKFETWLLPSSLIRNVIEDHKPEDYNALSTCVYLSYAFMHDKKPNLLGDKNNYYIKHLDELDRMAPDKFIIHIVRDGRDTACSYREIKHIDSSHKYKPILPTDITEIAEEWGVNNVNIFNFYKNRDNYILVTYEALLKNA
ncbi:sulfotransferase [Bizionia psychrotolerans]|uniref:sulfotransferase n=1 Tax=Bizionia psychrotolerans TaxID=1492901 RepID=UPI0006523BA6|nr:sulfotransferase [Bizionia psychrotolerans]